jgi:hypothetical protein
MGRLWRQRRSGSSIDEIDMPHVFTVESRILRRSGSTDERERKVMNPRMNDGGLSLPLRADLSISKSTTERDNRLHDGSPRDIESSVDVSVTRKAALLTDKRGLTLTVLFRTVTAHLARARRIAWVYEMQWHTSKSSLVLKKETELPE